ncbi:hypothetical protein HCN44_010328 [Aphidius gifuensis]|uniref:Uncharacterized protein n=1 Tax=Aphidius gifuensis TaxID=684658 RepID=A0A834XUH8_APHGI|nr:hypothetical protein HCN44_010328 [Aphidius gifuensis]
MFANAKFSGKVKDIDVDLTEVLEDLEQKGLGEEIYSESKKPNIISEKILCGRHFSIISGKKKKSKSSKQKKHSKDINTEKQDPVLPTRPVKHGQKIITVDDDNEEKELSKHDNAKKQDPVLPPAMHKSGKYGQKIITVDDDNEKEGKYFINK